MRLVILAAAALSILHPLSAMAAASSQIVSTWGTLKASPSKEERGVFELYLGGGTMAYGFVNAYNEASNVPRLYCEPDKLGISGTDALKIVLDYAPTHSWVTDETPVVMILFAALKEKFPCPVAEARPPKQ
jgi:hypothetical protein